MNRRTSLRIFLLFGAAFLSRAEALAQARPGSIYDPAHGPISPIADKTARRPGDLLTVLIAETQGIKNEETSQLQRQTTLDYALTSFDIKPNAFNPLPGVAATSQDDFNGRANYEKKGQFTARITVLVVDVLPNGNLVIQGRREIRIDRETKVIEFGGVVRREDIKPDNTVTSELVADAHISYTGEGDLTEATNRGGLGGWIHRAIVWLWPF